MAYYRRRNPFRVRKGKFLSIALMMARSNPRAGESVWRALFKLGEWSLKLIGFLLALLLAIGALGNIAASVTDNFSWYRCAAGAVILIAGVMISRWHMKKVKSGD